MIILIRQILKTVSKNIKDFLDLFSGLPKKTYRNGKLKILIFNWRDIYHVDAGGSEVYIHQIAKRWVKNGHQVSLFCGNDQISQRNEIVDGVNTYRRGGFYTVYFWAFLYYLLHFKGKYDVIVESGNGVPFFTPFYSMKPKVLILHHVHQEVFKKELPYLLSLFARILESKITPLVYSRVPIVTVSNSSKSDLKRLGFGKNNSIHIIPPCVEKIQIKKQKTTYPSFAYLGRLKSYKNIDIAIKAFNKVVKEHSRAKLLIIGEGEYGKNLKRLVEKMKLTKSVIFLGKVDEKTKFMNLSRSWAAMQPSSFEGWGITVLEANICGTPVIASQVNGLRDSVVDRRTGLLVPPRNVKAFANAMLSLISSPELKRNLSKNALKWSEGFDWDINSELLMRVVVSQIEKGVSLVPINGLSFALEHIPGSNT